METLGSEHEDASLQKKKAKKFRLFGKKKSQPVQLDPNCPQCNPHLLAALEAKRREQQAQQQSTADKQLPSVHGSAHRTATTIPGGVNEDDDDTLSSIAEDRLPCDCRKCQQARSERPLTVELLPMDTQLPLQNMMQDAAFMCALL